MGGGGRIAPNRLIAKPMAGQHHARSYESHPGPPLCRLTPFLSQNKASTYISELRLRRLRTGVLLPGICLTRQMSRQQT